MIKILTTVQYSQSLQILYHTFYSHASIIFEVPYANSAMIVQATTSTDPKKSHPWKD